MCIRDSSYTVGDAYPMSTVGETLAKIGPAKLISTFDAKSGYWQIPVAEQDRWLTAYVTHDGLYEWVRMPFGLKNAVLLLYELLEEYCRRFVIFLSRMLMTLGLVRMVGHNI